MRHFLLALALALLPACGSEDPVKTSLPKQPTSAMEDSPKALMRLMKRLSAAAVAGKRNEALAMGRALVIPEAAKWFDEHFPEATAKRLTEEYTELAGRIDTLVDIFPMLHERGQTQLLVERHEDPKDLSATGYQSMAMGAMTKPTRLYSVRWLEPGEDAGFSLWSFVYVDGAFRFAGKMRALTTAVSHLGEVRRSDAQKILHPKKPK